MVAVAGGPTRMGAHKKVIQGSRSALPSIAQETERVARASPPKKLMTRRSEPVYHGGDVADTEARTPPQARVFYLCVLCVLRGGEFNDAHAEFLIRMRRAVPRVVR